MTGKKISDAELEKGRRNELEFHLSLGPDKCLSYLPIFDATNKTVLNVCVEDVILLAHDRGLKTILFDQGTCSIGEGALYFYSEQELERLVSRHGALLDSLGWQTSCEAVIGRIAAEWFDDAHPIMPFIAEAFGDSFTMQQHSKAVARGSATD